MKKLRLIQDRQVTESFLSDLRGLGRSPLLTDLPPCPYLVVDGADVAAMEPVETLFHLQLNPQGQTLVLESAVEETHKHKALRLWYAARHVLNHHPQVKLQIGERDLLREALIANIGQTDFCHPNRLRHDMVAVALHGAGTLALSVLLQHVLVQVGYPFVATEQDMVIRADDELFRFELPSIMRKALAV